MRSALQKVICICAVGGLAGLAQATVPEAAPGQYQAIPERNVFGLRPPAAQPSPTNQPAPLPKITLTGITTILGNKRALMKVLPPGGKPGDTKKEESLILTEGQREGEVEVLQIDEHAGSVKVNNSGTVMTLTFEKDGAKLPATPAPRPMPPLPNALPGTVTPNPYLPAAAAHKSPARIPRLPGFGATRTGSSGLGAVTPPVGGVPTPTGLTPAPAQTPTLADQNLTAEEQAIINAFQQQENESNPNNPQSAATPVLPLPNGAAPAQTLPAVPGRSPALVPQ